MSRGPIGVEGLTITAGRPRAAAARVAQHGRKPPHAGLELVQRRRARRKRSDLLPQAVLQLERLRQASDSKGKAVGALQDLCGPKVRTGNFAAPFLLPTGSDVILIEGDKSADERVIPIQYEGLAGDVETQFVAEFQVQRFLVLG